jgi:uncharacterized protein YjiS (DUF1127 family)
MRSTEALRASAGHARILGAFRGAWEAVQRWHDVRRQRRHVAGLNDWMLQDIGITRADVEDAVPSWRHWPGAR